MNIHRNSKDVAAQAAQKPDWYPLPHAAIYTCFAKSSLTYVGKMMK